MIEAIFNQPNYLAAKDMLDGVAMRHEAIAANIANIETPGYKRVELARSFSEALQRAVSTGEPEAFANIKPKLEIDLQTVATSPDGNNVELETELLHLEQNTVAHQVCTEFVSSNLGRIQLAIKGS